MKLTLFAACLAAVFAATSALKCYGVKGAKLCAAKGQAVDKALCAELPCTGEKNACGRKTTLSGTEAALTSLLGCVEAKEMKCTTTTDKTTGTETETCSCKGDLCNGAMMGSASMTAMVLTLASFVAVFVH